MKIIVMAGLMLLLVACGQKSSNRTDNNRDSVSISPENEIDCLRDMLSYHDMLKGQDANMLSEEDFVNTIKANLPIASISATDTLDYGLDCNNTSVEFLSRLSKLSVFPRGFSIHANHYCSYVAKLEHIDANVLPLLIKLEYAGGGYKSLIFASYNQNGKEIYSAILATNSFHLLPTVFDSEDKDLSVIGWTYKIKNDTIDLMVHKSNNSEYRDYTALKDEDATIERRLFHLLGNGKSN